MEEWNIGILEYWNNGSPPIDDCRINLLISSEAKAGMEEWIAVPGRLKVYRMSNVELRRMGDREVPKVPGIPGVFEPKVHNVIKL